MTAPESPPPALSPSKAALLELRLRGQARTARKAETIPRRAVEGPRPLSFAQQRLWFLQQWDPSSAAYNMPGGLRLEGPLDAAALARALGEIVRRHETLRTTFRTVQNEPKQFIGEAAPLTLETTDLSQLSSDEREARAQELLKEEARVPFNLERDPPARFRLLRLGLDHHVLLLTFHHIGFDGSSVAIFVRELAALYRAFATGKGADLPEPPIAYADYADWQRERLQGEALQKQLDYWRSQLGDAAALELATDRPRPPVQTHRGSKVPLTVEPEVAQQLRRLAREGNASLFMVGLAAFQTLLHRYTGQTDITVGSPISGRRRPETQGLIGFFVNTLSLRTDLSGDATFRQIVARVRQSCLGAYEHDDVPFEKVVEELRPERDLSRSPFFQTVFTLEDAGGNASPETFSLAGLRVSYLSPNLEVAKFDLTFSLVDHEGGLAGFAEYNSDLFDASTVRRMAGHFRILLRALAAHPDAPMSGLEMMERDERELVVDTWNRTRVLHPTDRPVHELVQERARATPEALAVSCGGHQITYRELDERSNQVARCVAGLGVGPDVPVGVCLERGVDMVVAILGVLKAGGAYLPMDPNYPPDRLAFMVSDSRIPLLLTHESLAHLFPAGGPRLLRLDADWQSMVATQPTSALAVRAGPRHLAYAIYTSGSTGQPKGVMIEHAGLLNLVHWHRRAYAVGPQDRATQLAGFAFDASVWEIWPYLVAGASLHIPPEHTRSDPEELRSWLIEHKVTVSFVPTPIAAHMLGGDWTQASLRFMLTGGDRLHRGVGTQLPFALVNHYGPTECSVVATAGLVQPGVEGAPPIGGPIDNTRAYVLDARRGPVPVGVPGELYLGGDGLARGYLGRPDLTQERFVANPFAPGQRLYRTGDRVRWLADGRLEFLGRMDDQVKIRGYRIELGEIEATLLRHAGLSAAAVVARDSGPGHRRLVAYFVAAPGHSPTTKELRDHLKRNLPDYMVPAAFVALDRLPLTPNGKVDRRALPEPRGDRPTEETLVAPRTETERALVGLWCSLLRVDRLGIHDNFFELGGHSLLATQMASRIAETFGVQVAVRTVFTAPTVQELAALIDAAPRRLQGTPPMVPVDRSRPLPLSFAQQRLWFLDNLKPENTAYNIPAGIRFEGSLDVDAMQRALNEIVRRHDVLRTTFPAHAGVPSQSIQAYEPFLLDLEDRPTAPEHRQEVAQAAVARQGSQPFQLARGPLYRFRLLRLAPDDHVLVLCFHHIVFDGWSAGVFVNELTTLYRAFEHGDPSPLRDLPLQYVDFAAWQRRWLVGGTLAAQLDHWKPQLNGVRPLELPTDRPRPPVQSFRGAEAAYRLPPDLVRRLHDLGRRHGASLFMTLLAAFNVLLQRYARQDDITVGSPIANRNRPETEALVGFFVNMIALRTDCGGDPTFEQLLGRVRETSLAAFAHQDVPFEKLVEAIDPERDLARSPIFQVAFALQNTPTSPVAATGLRISGVPSRNQHVRYDLEFHLWEGTDGLACRVDYSVELFDHATIDGMFRHFRNLLECAVNHPGRRLSEMPLMTPDERARMSVWNRTEVPFANDVLAHQLVSEWARRSPQAVAAADASEVVTYGRLNERANQLAHRLVSLGVGPGAIVGVALERSVQLLVAELAVLKAGAAYLPLDPAYPRERLAFMLEDADAQVLVTNAVLARALPSTGARLVRVDADDVELSREVATDPPNRAKPESLAYVIYTSGSTGQPKGVEIPHGGLLNLVQWHGRTFELSPSDRATLVASPAFDASVWETWPYLCAGASLHIPPDELRTSPPDLVEWLVRQRITVTFLPTPMAEQVLETPWPDGAALRVVQAAGDRLHRRPPVGLPFRLWNLYGPTEYSVATTGTPVDPGPDTGLPPIGRPIANTKVHVLDPNGNPVPVGVPGELYVSGAGLARGYLGRPELTQERFVVKHVEGLGPTRMYRTGDLVRYRPDGQLDFLGRLDHQVKVRGFRIELGEIESILLQHPSVREAAVAVHGRGERETKLVAYVVGASSGPSVAHGNGTNGPSGLANRDPATQWTEDLRGFLKQKLPSHMLPHNIVALERLPLTPNGKLDRAALPATVDAQPVKESVQAAPRTEAEVALAAVWAEVLDVPKVGRHDNFFDLGGDSILSLQAVARAKQRGWKITTRLLFQHQTLEQLARVATRDDSRDAEADLVTGEAPLTPIQQWFFQWDLPQKNHFNMSLMVDAASDVDPKILDAALSHLVRHHDQLRASYRRTASGWIQAVGPPRPGTLLERVDVSHIADSRQREAAIQEKTRQVQASMRLDESLLLRAALFHLGPTEPSRLLVAVHHLAIDAVSWPILLEDLETAYGQLSRKNPVQLPPKTTSFRNWSQRLAKHAESSKELLGEVDFWSAQGRHANTRVPLDRPEGENTMESMASVTARLTAEETGALLRDVPRVFQTRTHEILLAALLRAFRRWSGGDRFLVAMEGHGREDLLEDADLTRTVGWFTTMFPLSLSVPDSTDLGAWLTSVREQVRAVPNRGLGFGLLRYLHPGPEAEPLLRIPAPEISFNYLGQVDAGASNPELFVPYPSPSAGTGPQLIRPTAFITWGYASMSRTGPRKFIVDGHGVTSRGVTGFVFNYSENLHDRATLERFAQDFLDGVRQVIAESQRVLRAEASPPGHDSKQHGAELPKSSAASGTRA